jgi:hypothetical protein
MSFTHFNCFSSTFTRNLQGLDAFQNFTAHRKVMTITREVKIDEEKSRLRTFWIFNLIKSGNKFDKSQIQDVSTTACQSICHKMEMGVVSTICC